MSQRWSRAVIDVTVDPEADLDTAITALKSVAEKVAADKEWADKMLETPQVLGVQSLTHGGATLRVVVDTEPASQWQVARHIRLAIKLALDQKGIKISSSGDSEALRPKPPQK
jgi:small conductance mechanosensitive channel